MDRRLHDDWHGSVPHLPARMATAWVVLQGTEQHIKHPPTQFATCPLASTAASPTSLQPVQLTLGHCPTRHPQAHPIQA
eukprot:118565-Chlamydomonas_euryale.AAC.4